MKHKVFRSVFVLAVALGVTSTMVRHQDGPPARPPVAQNGHTDPLSRPLASYRVQDEPIVDGLQFRGADYKADVRAHGFVFGPVPEEGSRMAARKFTIEFGAPQIEQGAFKLECPPGQVSRPAHGMGRIDRGAVVEEYLFENRRAEQIFRIPAPLGDGDLRLSIPVQSDLGGPVIAHARTGEVFKDFRFAKGGLEFCNVSGETALAYYGAVVVDATGRQIPLTPRHESGKIILDVPAQFMNEAIYPVVIDPWIAIGELATGFHAAERPSIARFGSGSSFAGDIAWSDNSTGNFEIYVVSVLNGVISPLGTSLSPGGISSNPGRSVNPSIVLNSIGEPFVAWEDDSSRTISIYLKHWNSTGRSWEELAGSATNTGVSGNLASNQHPSVGFMNGVVPGLVTVNPTTGAVTSSPPTFVDCPVVAWNSGSVYCNVFYPGQQAVPPGGPDPNTGGASANGLAAVPAGWYQLGTLNGAGVGKFSANASVDGLVSGAEFPSLVVDSMNRPAIAYHSPETGNFEVYVHRWTYNAVGAPLTFQIASNSNNTGFNFLPPANFRDVTGAAGTGIVSGGSPPSQFPSLAAGGINLTLAWQATESAVPPNPPGTTSQIYVMQSVGGGAFAPMGASTFPGGISKTLAQASTPSVDVASGNVGVAWADTSNSRSSIYVRQFNPAGPSWAQIGFQGSAFPPAFVGETAPIEGVSQSANFAIQPQLSMGAPITVVWADGDLSNFNILGTAFYPNAPGTAVGIGTNNPSFAPLLQQSSTDPALGITPVQPGGLSSGTSIWLFARVFTETLAPTPGNTLELEIEIQPAGAAFTGTAQYQTLFVGPDTPAATPANLAVRKFDGLPNFNYHWRARTVDQIGRSSPWLSPGEVSGVSFRINAAAGPGGGPGSNGPVNAAPVGPAHRGNCGLTGLEAVALLGLLRVLRRRRAM